jgi:uncharacterized membrane protein YhhN
MQTKTTKVLFTTAITAALLFIVLLPGFHPYPLSFILKLIPLLCLSILISLNTGGRGRVLILLALSFCMIGDVLFDLDRSGNFKMGLAAFLTGHIFYIIVFQLNRQYTKSRLPYLIFILVYTLIIIFFLKDIDRDFLIPVMAYLAVISIMTLSAFLMKNFSWYIGAGALVFMFSDTIIAINKFLTPIPYSTVFNIGLYFTAQILIIRGLLIVRKRYKY